MKRRDLQLASKLRKVSSIAHTSTSLTLSSIAALAETLNPKDAKEAAKKLLMAGVSQFSRC